MRELVPFERLPRRPFFLAPPLRCHRNVGAEFLTLHTIQTRGAYDLLRSDGSLAGNPEFADSEFAEPYAWMRRQMAARLRTNGEGMLWLWARITYRDLVRNAKHAQGQVLLTVRLPSERVLLSHFNDWHSVLNNSLLVPLLPGETLELWSSRFDAIQDEFDARAEPFRHLPVEGWPKVLRDQLERSWDAIFDPVTWSDERCCLQATTFEIHASDVVRTIRIL